MNDPAAQIGFQVSQTALKHGQEYMEQNASIPFNQADEFMLTNGSLTAMSTSLHSSITSTFPTPML
jgi:hypothetical protein